MSEFKCRNCGATRRNDDSDPDYCSGKCRRLDERGPLTETGVAEVGEAEVVIVDELPDKPKIRLPDGVTLVQKGSLDDYYARPEAYHRRLEPEKLNWGIKLDVKQLKQAGLRANRVPIPGDWDFVESDGPKTA